MAFSKTFQPAVPTGSDLVSDVDTFITDFKVGINERLCLEHYNLTTSAPNAGSATDSAATAQGRHIPGKCSVCYVGATGDLPASPPTGALAYDTTLGQLVVAAGGAWSTGQVIGSRVAFRAERTAASISAPAGIKLTFTSETFDYGAGWDVTNSKYVVPITGVYSFNYAIAASSCPYKTQGTLRKNNVDISGAYGMAYSGEPTNASMINASVLIDCTLGDVIELWWLYEAGTSKSVSAVISGFKVI
jgi:hypothetical protein